MYSQGMKNDGWPDIISFKLVRAMFFVGWIALMCVKQYHADLAANKVINRRYLVLQLLVIDI